MSHFETSQRPRPVYWKHPKQLGAKDFPGVTLTAQDGIRTLEKEPRGTQNDSDGNHKETRNNRKTKERAASRGAVLGSSRGQPTDRKRNEQ